MGSGAPETGFVVVVVLSPAAEPLSSRRRRQLSGPVVAPDSHSDLRLVVDWKTQTHRAARSLMTRTANCWFWAHLRRRGGEKIAGRSSSVARLSSGAETAQFGAGRACDKRVGRPKSRPKLCARLEAPADRLWAFARAAKRGVRVGTSSAPPKVPIVWIAAAAASRLFVCQSARPFALSRSLARSLPGCNYARGCTFCAVAPAPSRSQLNELAARPKPQVVCKSAPLPAIFPSAGRPAGGH